MYQIFALIGIILTLAFILKKHPEKITIKKMAITAILLSVALLMTLFSLNLFLFGGQVVIRFSQLVLILLGAALGPIYAVIAGFGFDVLNLIINPLGTPYLGFTLNNIWVGLFAALVFKYLSNKKHKTQLSALFGVIIAYAAYVIVVLTLFVTNQDLKALIDSFAFNMIKSTLILSFIIITTFTSLVFLFKKQKFDLVSMPQPLILLIISSVLVEFFIQGFLTPLWLYDMAKTPILLSMQIRAVKGGLMVFINSFVGYAVYETIISKVVNKS